MTTDAMTHEEFQAKMDEEIEYAGYKRGDLQSAFNRVVNKENWKMAIDAVIPESELDVTHRAIEFFTGSEMTCSYFGDGNFRVKAEGYYARIGA